MAPPPPPPELIEDAVAEILLRLPPDEPRCLFRASLVCKPWRRLLTSAAFLRRYRRFHRTPPLLGIFLVLYPHGGDKAVEALPRFIPTTVPSPFPSPMLDCRSWVTLDCRHGRVLLQKSQGGKFVVWDPITGDREELDPPCIPFEYFSVALLCAAPGCDHCDCHGGPFLVVWVCNDVDDDGVTGMARACVYSSQVGSWGTPVSVRIRGNDFISRIRGAFARDGVYFRLEMGSRILKYDLVKHRLSFIDPPPRYSRGIFIVPTEDGLLGIAGICGSCLELWSRKVNAEGVEGWMLYRVIELKNLFTDDQFLHEAAVFAFAEGVRLVFIDTSSGISIIDLNSEQARAVSEQEVYYPAVPFTSFYTPDCACGKLPLPAETNLSLSS